MYSVDNEQLENVVFSIRYSLQQLEERLLQESDKKEKNYFDICAKFDNNMQSLLATMQAIHQDVLQLRVAVNDISRVPSTMQPVLSPKTPVVDRPEDVSAVRESSSQMNIKWDERASDVAPEESFGFKIPNKK